MNQISDYGILGYGIDIIDNDVKKLVLDFTYHKGQKFNFHQEDIFIPDQFAANPGPGHDTAIEYFSDVITTARDFQRNLLIKVGLSGTVKGIEFSGDADVVNRLFTSDSETSILQYIDYNADYIFLKLDDIDLATALLPEVNTAAGNVNNIDDALAFYRTYGTHIVNKTGVGGQMSVRTNLTLTSDASKKIVENGIKIAAEAKKEAYEFKTNLDFGTRSTNIENNYRSISSVRVNRLGGDITAANATEWVNSLKNSRIATQTAHALRSAMFTAGPPEFYLALVGLKYAPIYTILNHHNRAIFEEAL